MAASRDLSLSVSGGEESRRQVMNVPFGKMIEGFAAAIQSAQMALDTNSLAVAETMGDPDQGATVAGGSFSLLELGLTPTFYHFTEGQVEIRVSISITRSRSSDPNARFALDNPVDAGLAGTPVDSTLANKYSYPARDSGMVRARLVSVPVPPALGERLQRLLKTS